MYSKIKQVNTKFKETVSCQYETDGFDPHAFGSDTQQPLTVIDECLCCRIADYIYDRDDAVPGETLLLDYGRGTTRLVILKRYEQKQQLSWFLLFTFSESSYLLIRLADLQ